MVLANWNNGANIVFTIISVIIIAFLAYLLFKSFQKEQRNYRNEQAELMDGVAKKSEIVSYINNYITRSPSTLVFSMILIEFDNLLELQNAFGDNNVRRILDDAVKNVRRVLPFRTQIGRISEEKFVVLIKEDYDKNEVLNMTNKVRDAAILGSKIYADTLIKPTVNIGVAFYPNHGKNYKQLIKSLDLAVFSSKSEGNNTITIYSNEIDGSDVDNLQLYNEVKNAVKNQEFTLFYQPIINLNDNTIYGLEALLRWKHPSLGILSPASFINILEQSGDINIVGIWGIEALIKEYIELKKQFIYRDFQLSFNLSPKQLVSDTLGITFQRVAKKYKIPVNSITIEIVEFAMFEKHEIVNKNIQNLKELGFKVAVDGLGIDQNTLGRLGNSPIDIIKVDKTFLDSEGSYVQSKYIELLIDFAKRTNKTIICEGIETLEELEKVKSYGIEYAQGYFFSKPMPQADVEDYVLGEYLIGNLFEEKVEDILPTVEATKIDIKEELVEEEKEDKPQVEEEIIAKETTEETVEVQEEVLEKEEKTA